MKYTLYHIQGIKWGCSNDLINRLKYQGYTLDDVSELISCDDLDLVSEYEKYLNLKEGYKWSDGQLYKKCLLLRLKTASKGGKIGGRIGGKIGGKATKKTSPNKGRPAKIENSILCFDKKTNQLIGEYEYLTQASIALNNMSKSKICSVLKGRIKSCYGYYFKYK